jgi:hypothetical protein
VFGFERDHVDHEVEAVRNGQRAFMVAVECDVLEPVGRLALVFACERRLPAVSCE